MNMIFADIIVILTDNTPTVLYIYYMIVFMCESYLTFLQSLIQHSGNITVDTVFIFILTDSS